MAIEIDYNVLEAYVEMGATCLDCAGKFNCSEDTIVRRIKDKYNMNFAEYSDKLFYKVRMKLRQKMLDEAMRGNTAILIFLAKNYLGLKDKQDIDINKDIPININISQADANL